MSVGELLLNEFVNTDNFKMFLLFSSKLSCATALYFCKLIFSTKLEARCKEYHNVNYLVTWREKIDRLVYSAA